MLDVTTEILSSVSKLSGVITNSKLIRIFIATPPSNGGRFSAPAHPWASPKNRILVVVR